MTALIKDHPQAFFQVAADRSGPVTGAITDPGKKWPFAISRGVG
jgi:hypothetical protein